MIIVSHDRWLLSHIPTKIIRFVNGEAFEYTEGFEAMQQQMAEPEVEQSAPKPKVQKSEKTKEYRTKSQRSADAQAKQRLLALEDEIAKLEEEQTKLQEKLCDPEVSSDYQQLSEISKALEDIGILLPQLYDDWNALVGD